MCLLCLITDVVAPTSAQEKHHIGNDVRGKVEETKPSKSMRSTTPMLLRFAYKRDCSYVFTKIRRISIFPNLLEQINGLGSFLHVKSQIKFSLSIHTTQQVVAKRLESLPGVSQLWHLKWALHTDATSAPLANSPPFLTLETFNTMTRRNICKL